MGGERVTFNALVMPNTQAVVEYVRRHPEAVGYVSMAPASPIRCDAVPVEGLLPTPRGRARRRVSSHPASVSLRSDQPRPQGRVSSISSTAPRVRPSSGAGTSHCVEAGPGRSPQDSGRQLALSGSCAIFDFSCRTHRRIEEVGSPPLFLLSGTVTVRQYIIDPIQ